LQWECYEGVYSYLDASVCIEVSDTNEAIGLETETLFTPRFP